MTNATVVLVHGGWGTPEDWRDVIGALEARSVRAVAVDLPSCRQEGRGDMHADAAAIRDAIDSCDGDVVVCGWSYGGVPMTEGAAGHAQVVRLVYLAALMPDENETTLGILSSQPPDPDELPPIIRDDGTALPDLTDFEQRMAHHPREVVERMLSVPRRPQAVASAMQSPAAVAWRDIPSTYVVALQDRNVHPDVQRGFAARATGFREIDCDHFAPFARPDLVAEILAEAAAAKEPAR